jgi:prepilin-type N-terminal cleavage/methylation domain-containing protein
MRVTIMKATSGTSGRRSAFTLIELIVVVSIILVLAGIAALLLPRVLASEKASQGASQVQGWLMIARGRAIRDQAPRGLRLNLNSDPLANSWWVVNLQYIEQPEDLGGVDLGSLDAQGNKQGRFLIALTYNTLPSGVLANVTADFAGNPTPIDFFNGSSDPNEWLVQPGDYVEVNGGGLVFRVAFPSENGGNPTVTSQIAGGLGNRLILAPPPRNLPQVVPTIPTWRYRIIRQPRVLTGEDALELPRDVAIDLTKSVGFQGGAAPAALFNGNAVDILFDRFGNVIGQAAAYDKIVLWVLDVTMDPTSGDQTLISINSRSGLAEAHAVNFDPTLGGFYIFTQDGRSPGT